jgi:farnesol dehydrogenase
VADVKILVTGAGAPLGDAIASRLVSDGHDVLSFGRASEDDLQNPAAVRRAITGRDAVVHAASEASIWLRDRRAYDRTNIQGFGNVAQAARTEGARLLYLSSFTALGPTDGTIFDEGTPRATMKFHSDHERTMWVADQMARHLAAEGMEIVLLYPGSLFGADPEKESESIVGPLVRAAAGTPVRLPGSGRKRQCFSFIEDVVDGTVRALEKAPAGAAYILGGENRNAREFIAALADAMGTRGGWRGMPPALAVAAGRLRRWMAELSGVDPRLPDSLVRFYLREWAYSSERAIRELGYGITPFEEAVAGMTK